MHDTIIPQTSWRFDSDVTAVFDDMLARSIPQYEVMRKACYDLTLSYLQPNSAIVDIGCSRGEAIAALSQAAQQQIIGLEISEPMLQAARFRFQNVPHVEIRQHDLRLGYPAGLVSCVYSDAAIHTD
jgi:tRNA (cmo5U34)-methyltransferase